MSTLAIGGTVAPGLAIAGTIQGTSVEGTFNGGPTNSYTVTRVVNGTAQTTNGTLSGHATGSMFVIGAQADWFPRPTDGWHVGAAIGVGGAAITDDTAYSVSGITAGFSLFGGYTWWLGPSWSLGLMGLMSTMPSIKANDQNGNSSGYSFMPFTAGLQTELLYY
jgi:hypothetical protein